ncbi:hypothetical protein N7470_004861 [Penicillium chermesinum]|nr:hypothetical protein N7470_004861 [Penicillium chermesinum]
MGSSSPEHSGRPQANISEPSNDFNFRREAQTHHASKPSHVAPTIVTSGINTPEVEHADAELRPDSSTPEKPVTCSSLPKKGQLAILTLARLSEPLTQTSLQAYPLLPTEVFYCGPISDSLLVGPVGGYGMDGTERSLVDWLVWHLYLLFGVRFSRNFATAAVFRTLNGVLNSNVGVSRTMVSEIIVEKSMLIQYVWKKN